MDEEQWRKRFQREKTARKQAEKIAEDKTREIFFRNQELSQLAESLEEKVRERTAELEENNARLKSSRDILRAQRRELREFNQALEQKAKELEEASQFKSEFLANISHELRTPLNSLLILTSLLVKNEEGNLSEDQMHSLRIIYNSANELQELIEEVLDLSKVEAGQLNIHTEDLLLTDILHSLKDQYIPVSKEKNIQFTTEVSENFQRRIHTDRKRVKQILKNLLSNAFKFTGGGGEVVLRVFKETLSRGEFTSEGLVFEVKDNGPGIAEDQQETIFQMFRQADAGRNRKFEGAGMGLSIARKLALLLGGDLTLTSELGKGSAFRLHLPPETLVTSIPDQKDIDGNLFFLDSETNYEKQFNPSRILLVDDDLRNSFALSRLLQGMGLQVHISENGRLALEHLKNGGGADLILLDLMMPEMTGIEFIKQVRSQVAFNMLPVIVLTASNNREDELNCRTAGADDYLQKPIEVSVLVERINSWLK